MAVRGVFQHIGAFTCISTTRNRWTAYRSRHIVSTRTNEDLFAAEQAVDHRKRQNIIRVANNYVHRTRRTEPLRFDIIAIVGSGATAEIRHTKDAFNVFNY